MAGGGGAWKVAYADFVTAMMAFFLVMWICSQDSKVKKSVADYFNGHGMVRVGSRHPTQVGGPFAARNHGTIPHSQDVFLGRGRDSHTPQREHGKTTRMVSTWLSSDEKASKYWREQGAKQRDLAGRSKDVLKQGESVNQVAAQQLAKQLEDEVTQGLFAQAKGLYQELLYETIATINWDEVAQDILSQE